MRGARQDLSEQFRSVGEREEIPPSPEPSGWRLTASRLFVRRPDADEWEPLAIAVDPGGASAG